MAHGALGTLFVGLSALLQGIGDAAPTAEPAFIALTLAGASALRRSWDAGFKAEPEPPPAALFAAASAVAPSHVSLKTAEGFAYYALYPEAYREAARSLPRAARIIGVRSIGAGLACVVAEAAGAAPPITVRPFGHPFAREAKLTDVRLGAVHAVIDEGPGLSGSSFGAVADALEAQGVPAERIVFLPGHAGDLGPQASERHRRRWGRALRLHVGFDSLIAPRVPGWVETLTGRAHAVEDVSGGAWRRLTHGPDPAGWPPSAANQERRKFIIRSDRGAFLVKFTGLGEHGLAALRRAQGLHAAGFSPEPLGWRHGFQVERWIESRPLSPADRPALLHRLAAYLAFRRRAFTAEAADGASLSLLAEMARTNVWEALGDRAAARLPEPPRSAGSGVEIDGRLHDWEWRVAGDGRILKTDAVDHAAAHDRVGAQPADWDMAGAIVELVLDSSEAALLGSVHDFWVTAYSAFQLGLWTNAAESLVRWPAEARRCRRQAERYADVISVRLGL